MPKTGSTSIQGWIENGASGLQRSRDVRVLVTTPRETPEPELRVAAYRVGGELNSGGLFRLARRAEGASEQLAESLCTQIDAYASRHETVLLTGEGLAFLFREAHKPFLAALNELARRHRVRIAYYVRPQHTALESAWKQWGFRSPHSPARYLERRTRQLHYFDSYQSTRRRGPLISFEPRPFRTDLLDGGDVVVDFARRFLGVDDPAEVTGGVRTRTRIALASGARTLLRAADTGGGHNGRRNVGLPLEIANALSQAPPGLLGESIDDNRRFDPLKKLVAERAIADSETAARSRAILQAYAFRTFEAGNLALIAELGWNTANFIPPPEESGVAEGEELARLDELWQPHASPAELALLYEALDRALPKRRAALLARVRRRAPEA